MEFPSGGLHHHHHHRRDGGEDGFEEYPPPPRFDDPPPRFAEPPPRFADPPPPFADPPPQQLPSYFMEGAPPQPVIHANHSSYAGERFDVPPPHYPPFSQQQGSFDPHPPPPHGSVHHVSHESADPFHYYSETKPHDHFRPHLPSFVHHHTHTPNLSPDFLNKPAFRVYCRARTDYSLTVRDGKVVLASSDPSDLSQHWIKDEKYSTKVKDKEGFPSFALVNKATGQAIKHSIGDSHPVRLIQYIPDAFDESILWTESKDLGDGFRTIRMINNIHLNFDASHVDKIHGGIRDGAIVVLEEWKKGDSQRWKIFPY